MWRDLIASVAFTLATAPSHAPVLMVRNCWSAGWSCDPSLRKPFCNPNPAGTGFLTIRDVGFAGERRLIRALKMSFVVVKFINIVYPKSRQPNP